MIDPAKGPKCECRPNVTVKHDCDGCLLWIIMILLLLIAGTLFDIHADVHGVRDEHMPQVESEE